VWTSQRERGYPVSTLTPEFGADGYLHHLPFTNMPVADLWTLTQWMARTEREHFDRFTREGARHA
ncbi:sugar phosphate isomerase/epimerase, partial [Variovorax sp. 2RAF20]